MGLVKLLAIIREKEGKDRLIQSAFIGFQLGAGGDKTFGAYLESWGLMEGIGMTPSPVKDSERVGELDAKAAIAKAEGILKAAREKRS